MAEDRAMSQQRYKKQAVEARKRQRRMRKDVRRATKRVADRAPNAVVHMVERSGKLLVPAPSPGAVTIVGA
jgi:hypothetical protein